MSNENPVAASAPRVVVIDELRRISSASRRADSYRWLRRGVGGVLASRGRWFTVASPRGGWARRRRFIARRDTRAVPRRPPPAVFPLRFSAPPAVNPSYEIRSGRGTLQL